MGPNALRPQSLHKEEKMPGDHRNPQKESHVTTEAQRDPQGLPATPKARGEAGTDSPLEPAEKAQPADTWLADLQPPGL